MKIGNLVQKLALPIARFLDKYFHTDYEECVSCKEMKRLLNDKKFLEAFEKRFKK